MPNGTALMRQLANSQFCSPRVSTRSLSGSRRRWRGGGARRSWRGALPATSGGGCAGRCRVCGGCRRTSQSGRLRPTAWTARSGSATPRPTRFRRRWPMPAVMFVGSDARISVSCAVPRSAWRTSKVPFSGTPRRHRRWRRKHLFGPAALVCGRGPVLRPVAAEPEPEHPFVHDVWPEFGLHYSPQAAVGMLGHLRAQCRRCGMDACCIVAWKRMLASPRVGARAADIVWEDATHAVVAVEAVGYRSARCPLPRCHLGSRVGGGAGGGRGPDRGVALHGARPSGTRRGGVAGRGAGAARATVACGGRCATAGAVCAVWSISGRGRHLTARHWWGCPSARRWPFVRGGFDGALAASEHCLRERAMAAAWRPIRATHG